MENQMEHKIQNDLESGSRGLGIFANMMVPDSM